MDKKEIRDEVRRKRAALSIEEWKMKSHQVCEKIWNLRDYRRADVVYAYMAKQGEVLLDELIQDAWQQGKRVVIPKVMGTDMEFYELAHMEDVVISSLGIREPASGRIVHGKNSILLMPAIALDLQRHRVGQGGGYYDRYLERYPMPVKIGVAFDFQIYPRVPNEKFDILADTIVTETRVLG